MAKCKFPISLIKSYYRTGKRSGCNARAKTEIVFQGKKIPVCKVHSQYDGRENAF